MRAGNTFVVARKSAAHLTAAREQVRVLTASPRREQLEAPDRSQATFASAGSEPARLEAALREVERLQRSARPQKPFGRPPPAPDPERTWMRRRRRRHGAEL